MEVGEYIRNNDGGIGKITKVINETIFYVQYYDNIPFKTDIYETKIKARSKNIIDLIEVGDYVNGGKVNKKSKNYITVAGNTFGTRNLSGIKTILTHEMYEQNCYKVGGENE